MKRLIVRHPFLTISLILLFIYGLGHYVGAQALEYFFLQEQMAELAPSSVILPAIWKAVVISPPRGKILLLKLMI